MEGEELPELPESNGSSSDDNPAPKEISDVFPKRVRCYPEFAKGPYKVFVRQKDKPINVLLVSAELQKNFKTVKEVRKVTFSKLRIVFGNREEANNAVFNELLSRLYRVYVPADRVEIDGVAYQADLDCNNVIEVGKGKFKDPRIPSVSILDCHQLAEGYMEDGKKQYTLSHSYRITFEGTIIPDYLEIHRVLIPVRLYTPKPMQCAKCARFGHTESFCANKPRCGKCGQNHNAVECNVHENICVHCKGSHDSKRDCHSYKQRVKLAKNRILQKSKMSYAEIIRLTTFNEVEHENPYSSLSDLSDNEDNLPSSNFREVRSRKRARREKKVSFPVQTPICAQSVSQASQPSGSNVNPVRANSTPGFHYKEAAFPKLVERKNHSEDFPTLVSGKLSVVTIIRLICDLFKLDPVWTELLNKLSPLLSVMLGKLISSWPPLGALIEIDG